VNQIYRWRILGTERFLMVTVYFIQN